MNGLRELLLFYADAGVDAALEEEPVSRLADAIRTDGERRANQSPQPARDVVRESAGGEQGLAPSPGGNEPSNVVPTASIQPSVPSEAQALRARDLARQAASLEELRSILAEFDGCNLRHTAKNLVFGDGNPEAPVMFIGEAPGREEDIAGLPFVGRSGRLLDRMLAGIGLDRTSAYIANVIPWRPPGNRTPTPIETEICRPFIERQIELCMPRVIVTLGGPSMKLVTGAAGGVLRLRGTWREHRTSGGATLPVMPTLHPAYLLRNPAHKKLAWRDLLEARARLEQTAT